MTTPMQTQPQTPISGPPKPRPRSGRTPLQPKNSPADPRPKPKPKPKPDVEPRFEITPIRDSDDKENRPIAAAAAATPPPPAAAAPPSTQLPDASSLAEELSAIKKKLERLRLDRENTEKTLNEKDAKLDAMMMELEDRGEVQKKLEIEVDRLFRLKELKYRCMVKKTISHNNFLFLLFDSFLKS